MAIDLAVKESVIQNYANLSLGINVILGVPVDPLINSYVRFGIPSRKSKQMMNPLNINPAKINLGISLLS